MRRTLLASARAAKGGRVMDWRWGGRGAPFLGSSSGGKVRKRVGGWVGSPLLVGTGKTTPDSLQTFALSSIHFSTSLSLSHLQKCSNITVMKKCEN